MKITDKYNVIKLFDAMDSYISQEYLFVQSKLDNDEKLSMLMEFLKTVCHKMQKATSLNLFKNSG